MKKIVSFFGDKSEDFVILNEKAKTYAKSLGFEYEWIPQLPFSKESVVEALKHADAGIIDIEPYNDEIFSKIENGAKLLVRFGVGYDKVDLEAAEKRGLAIARTTGANTLGVAEMALTLMLSAKRSINKNDNCVRNVAWARNVSNEIIGGTVGILGFGAIGKALCKLLKGFNCKILISDPYANELVAKEYGVEIVSVEDLFKRSDAISVHIPYTKENHHIIGEKLLSSMKPSSVIVNTARGGLIDEYALYEALKNRTIFGAGLDVFETEPLPSTSKLLTLDNIVMTPHVSSQTMESLWRIYEMAIDITKDFYENETSPHILNPGYKNYVK